MLMKEYIPILFSKGLAKIQFRSPSATLRIDSSTAQVGTVCSKFCFVSELVFGFLQGSCPFPQGLSSSLQGSRSFPQG